MKVCVKVLATYGDFSNKGAVNWCTSLAFIFKILKLSITLDYKKKSLICVAGSGIIFRSLNAKIIKKTHPLTLQNGAGLFVPM